MAMPPNLSELDYQQFSPSLILDIEHGSAPDQNNKEYIETVIRSLQDASGRLRGRYKA